MANVYKKTFKIKYITHYTDYEFHDGIQSNLGKFYVEAADIQEAINIVKNKLNVFLGDTAKVYILGAKEVI